MSGSFKFWARLGRRAYPGRRTCLSRRAHPSHRTRPGLRVRLGIRARPGRRTRLGIRPCLDCQARSARRARPGHRARSVRRIRLEYWANDLDGLDRAILTNLMAQSCSMGRQASRSSGHPACLGFPVDPARVGHRV